MSKFRCCLLVSVAATLSAQQTSVTVSTSRDARGNGVTSTFGVAGANYDPSHILVQFANGAPRDFLPGSGPVRAFPGNANLFRVENPPGLSVADAVQRYQRNPNVRFAEPDFIVQAVATPTDPMWGSQWDMTKIAAPTAWDSQTDASEVIVAVVDTGIDYTHEDLQGNLWTSGTSHGFTCINGSCVAGGTDDFGHGTHVAGTIGAVANNGKGIAGLNWHIQLLSIKFLDSNGSGLISDAVLGFQQILALKQAGYNIRVTSNSWGGGGFSQALKDAMAAVEAAGIVNVCAAGNNAQNADISPMYPGAYDNRGIISVLASDGSDVGAYFTNFGLASVDIAAPGVNTLSTVPMGACTLCDPSGYKLLSGTSMATPHVSGVMAALLHQHPGLTAFQARDVVLDPSSYDTLSDAKAKSTSTGGRLNFYKTLNNTRLLSPVVLNNFPTLTMGPDATAGPGGAVNLIATASDADAGDAAGLRLAWNKSVSTGTQWLFGWMLNSVFPNPSGPSVSFAAPSLARVATVPYYAAVTDNRGGGASGGNFVTVTPAANGGLPPTGTVSVSNAGPAVGDTITVNFPANDPDGSATPPWDVWIGGPGGASGTCCFTGSAVSVKFNSAGVYRVGAQAIDPQLNLSTRSSTVVKVGGAMGEPPLAAASLDKLSGPVPLTVNIDMSGSKDTDGTVQWYYFICNGGGFTAGSQSSQGSCTFTTPGAYWIMLEIQDNSGNVDLISAYVVATPVAGGGDKTPPTVSITGPADKAIVTGTVAIAANATDSSGVKQVDFYVDNVFLATSTGPSYTVNWDTSGLVPGSSHTLKATAIDNAGNSNSASVSVTIFFAPLAVTLTAPANGSSVTRKSNVNLTANTTGSYPVARVDFLVNNVVVCSDTSSPYSCAWKVPAAIGKTYQIQAKAYDSNGATAPSTVATVNAK